MVLRDAMGGLKDDCRFSVGVILRNRLSSLCVVATILLAVGANNVLFTVVNALWLRPFPVSQAATIGIVHNRITLPNGQLRLADNLFHPNQLKALEEDSRRVPVSAELSPDGLMGEFNPVITLGGSDRPLRTAFVAANYFNLMGVRVLGRSFALDSRDALDTPEVIISDALWKSRFGGARSVLGSEVAVNTHPCVVVGIAPPLFKGPFVGDDVELWLNLETLQRFLDTPISVVAIAPLRLFVRLPPGRPRQQVEREVGEVLNGTVTIRSLPEVRHPRLTETSKANDARLIALLTGTAILVFVLGCVNLTALLIARTNRRTREMAIRVALGISRSRMTRLVLTEAVILACVSTACVVVVSSWCIRACRALTLPDGTTIGQLNAGTDWRIAAFAFCLSVCMMSVCSLASVHTAAWLRRPARLLSESNPAFGGRGGRRRFWLMAVECALSVILLTGALLLVTTVRRTVGKELGFAADELVDVSVQPRLSPYGDAAGHYDAARRSRDSVRVVSELARIPGVTAVTNGQSPLLTVSSAPGTHEVAPDGAGALSVRIGVYEVGADYFRVTGIPLLSGRDFGPEDAGEPPMKVAIVTRGLADLVFSRDTSPLGQQVTIDGRLRAGIVGVAADAIHAGAWGSGWPAIYLPAPVRGDRIGLGLIVRTRGSSERAKTAIHDAVVAVFPRPVQLTVTTPRDDIRRELASQTLGAWLFSFFGVLALVLTGLGLWGMVSHGVAARKGELAVRLALGATPGSLVRRTVVEALASVLWGEIAGLALAANVGFVLKTYLVGVDGWDPVSLGCAITLLALIAVLSAFAAAHRITSIDPGSVLKQTC